LVLIFDRRSELRLQAMIFGEKYETQSLLPHDLKVQSCTRDFYIAFLGAKYQPSQSRPSRDGFTV